MTGKEAMPQIIVAGTLPYFLYMNGFKLKTVYICHIFKAKVMTFTPSGL